LSRKCEFFVKKISDLTAALACSNFTAGEAGEQHGHAALFDGVVQVGSQMQMIVYDANEDVSSGSDAAFAPDAAQREGGSGGADGGDLRYAG
jgi:hypothetical protein